MIKTGYDHNPKSLLSAALSDVFIVWLPKGIWFIHSVCLLGIPTKQFALFAYSLGLLSAGAGNCWLRLKRTRAGDRQTEKAKKLKVGRRPSAFSQLKQQDGITDTQAKVFQKLAKIRLRADRKWRGMYDLQEKAKHNVIYCPLFAQGWY